MTGWETGRPTPNPGIAALPQAAPASSARVPAALASARSAAISGSAVQVAAAEAEVGARRVVQVPERQGAPDDGHGVAGLQAGFAVLPASALPIDRPPRRRAAGRVRVVDRQQGRDRRRVIELRRLRGRPGTEGQPRRRIAREPRLVVEPDGRVHPGATREDAQASCRVTHLEADRPLLGIAAVGDRGVSAVADRGPVVHARRALQQRHEGQLGRLDHAADPKLAGRRRADRRGRRVPDQEGRAEGSQSAGHQPEAGDHAGSRRDLDPGQRRHTRIVRDCGPPERPATDGRARGSSLGGGSTRPYRHDQQEHTEADDPDRPPDVEVEPGDRLAHEKEHSDQDQDGAEDQSSLARIQGLVSSSPPLGPARGAPLGAAVWRHRGVPQDGVEGAAGGRPPQDRAGPTPPGTAGTPAARVRPAPREPRSPSRCRRGRRCRRSRSRAGPTRCGRVTGPRRASRRRPPRRRPACGRRASDAGVQSPQVPPLRSRLTEPAVAWASRSILTVALS